LGLLGERAIAPEPKQTLQGKKFTEEILHGNQEEGCEEEKETLTVLRDDTRKEPKGFHKKPPERSTSAEAF
jgi:hypothetical protein